MASPVSDGTCKKSTISLHFWIQRIQRPMLAHFRQDCTKFNFQLLEILNV